MMIRPMLLASRSASAIPGSEWMMKMKVHHKSRQRVGHLPASEVRTAANELWSLTADGDTVFCRTQGVPSFSTQILHEILHDQKLHSDSGGLSAKSAVSVTENRLLVERHCKLSAVVSDSKHTVNHWFLIAVNNLCKQL